MHTSKVELEIPLVSQVAVTEDSLIGKGLGIHWEALDEDISVENLLAGKPSGESQKSFEEWLAARSVKKRRPRRI